MADHEISKLMWTGIAVALAASVFIVAKPEVKSLSGASLDNVSKVVKQIKIANGTDTDDSGGSNALDPASVVASAPYGSNGLLEVDKDGNGVVRLTDAAKTAGDTYVKGFTAPSQLNFSNSFNAYDLKTMAFSVKTVIEGDSASAIMNGSGIFSQTPATSIDVTNLDTSNATALDGMFQQASSLTTIKGLDKLNVSKNVRFDNMFQQSASLTNIGNLSSWDVSQGNYFNQMFTGTPQLKSAGDLEKWHFANNNVPQGTNMFSMSGITPPSWYAG